MIGSLHETYAGQAHQMPSMFDWLVVPVSVSDSADAKNQPQPGSWETKLDFVSLGPGSPEPSLAVPRREPIRPLAINLSSH